jgi:streptogramin lyase
VIAVALAWCIGIVSPASAQELTLARMNHAAWTAQDGAPQGIQTLAQAPDGTLWIGAIGGLFHFDGRTFTAFQSPAGQPEMPAEVVHSVLVTRDGTVWAGYYRSGVVRIARGRVTRFDAVDGRQVRLVLGLREARDGSVWAYADRRLLMRFAPWDGAWHSEATPPEAANADIDGLYLDASDVLWLAQNGHLFKRPLPGKTYRRTEVEVNQVLASPRRPPATCGWWTSTGARRIARAYSDSTGRADRSSRSRSATRRGPSSIPRTVRSSSR